MNLKYIIILLFLFVKISTFAQDLLPFVKNFSKTDYKGDNQVWDAVQANDNAFYFANNHFFLRYDGVKWEKYSLPNQTIIRAICADGDKIYCGSYNEFGYWRRIGGRMVYFTLSDNKKLFKNASDNEEVWKIFKFQGSIYFQTFNQLFVYNGSTIKRVTFPFQISYCFIVDKKIYVASIKNGLYLYENERYTKILQSNKLDNTIVHGIEKMQNETYIFTHRKGVYICRNNQIINWNNALNERFKTELINTTQRLPDGKIAVGTAFQGLYIIDLKRNTYVNISRSNALKNNSVLSMSIDSENNLWLGLDNGISHIEINSPFQFFSDNSGVLGSVYALTTTENGYLLGSNHGLFNYEDKNLSLIPNSQGQIWDIKKVNNNYIIGHNEGTYVLSKKKYTKLNAENGGWELLKSKFSNVYFQANYSGIVAYKDSTDFSRFTRFSGIIKPIKHIAQVKPNELWAADNFKSLYKIVYNDDFSEIVTTNITGLSNLDKDYAVKLFQFKNEIYFLIHGRWYIFNKKTNKLEINVFFDNTFKNTSQIISIDANQFLVLKNGLLYLLSLSKNKFIWKLIPSKYYDGKIINNDVKIYKQQNLLHVSLDDGFFIYDMNKQKIANNIYKIEAFYHNKLVSPNTVVNHNESIEIHIVDSNYGHNRAHLFYKIDGTLHHMPIKEGKLILNNMTSGTSTVHFFKFNGQKYQLVGQYSVTVGRPWYFSNLLILFYISFIFLVSYLYYRWNKMRYKQEIALKEEEIKHQKSIMDLELEAARTLKQQEIDKHILEVQVQTKAAEIAGKSLSIAKQTELIDSIRNILDSEEDMRSLKNRIKSSIKVNSINKNEWKSFETNLMQSNSAFVHTLNQKFPNLSPKDIKLCIYLKMNLSTKEIAPLMSISFRGVELQRYRLRKKLNVGTDVILSKFLISL